ncbi:hypothetical protein Ocin01_08125 [Orchesella cincta]|uniref:WAP domain-containing protein n=1 Tax=Orchesella cincta TaxID=48709 RepID=A0A1D2MZU1_ORCCI|nr:hypothetical protein Ocin01_08125 [Orchesella cincta]
MKQITSIHLCGLVLLATLMLVDSTPHQIHNLIRKRREPEPAPEPVSSSTPSSSSSPSSSSPHDSHEVTCDDKDISSLKKSCPNNDTCPMDDNTVEKCCHCLSLCCGSESGSSSEEKGMHMKNGTMNDSSSAESESGKGKEIGNKVKDAMHSAEGWLKNTGQNIKSGFDKAAESAKQTAGEMKDKVRQGINNVATKVKNATEGDKSDCKGKDSKCTTDTDMSKSGDGEGDNMSGSTESSSMNMSMNDTTHVPGMKKSKREVDPDALLSSSGSLQTSFLSSGSRDSMDNRESDSTEIIRTKSTTTRTKDSGRHRREQSGNGATDAPSSTTQQSRNRRAAAEMSTEMPASTMSPQSKQGRNKRETTQNNMSTTENSSSKGGNHRNRRSASTEMPGSTMSPQNNTGRNKRETPKNEDMSTTENSSSKEATTRRHRRAAAGTATTDNPGMVSSTTKPNGGRDRRAAPSKGETTTMSPSSTPAPSSEDDTDEEGDDDEEDEETTTESSKNMMKGKSIRPKNASVSVSLRVNDTNAKRRGNSGNVYFPISPGANGGPIFMDMDETMDYYGDGMDRPPTMVFPGGGVITAPGIGIQNIKKGNGAPDLSYYPPQASTSLSLEPSLSGSLKGGNHNHRGTGGAMGGSVFGGGVPGRGAISASVKPGFCQTVAAGPVNCIALQSRSEQCSFDTECSGVKKCCFYNCDSYKQIGVCEVPTLTRTKMGY